MTKAVLGGGLTGLSAAYYLLKKNPLQPLKLIESSKRTGGWIVSNLQPDGTTLFEQGPRTIRHRGEAGTNTLQLIEELGLGDQIVPISSYHPAARNRMVFAKGNLQLLPSSLLSIFKRQEPFSKPLIHFLLNDITSPKKSVEDESIYDFVSRRFGGEMADYLISPLICGICAGNAKEISVNFLLSNLFELEQKHGSISSGLVHNLFKLKVVPKPTGLGLKAKQEKWNVYSFIKGCESLPLALEKYLVQKNVQFDLNTSCKELVMDEKKVVLHLSNNETTAVDHLISAIPAYALGSLVEKQHPQLGSLLKRIKSVTVAVVNLKFDGDLLRSPAFGFLVAPKEKLPILGVIYDSCCFPSKDNSTVLTVMMGGFWFEEHFKQDPDESLLLETALSQLKNILGIDQKPTMWKVNILKQCLPQYVVGHCENLRKIEKYIEEQKLPLSLCGASYYGVGVNDVILSAKNVVDKL